MFGIHPLTIEDIITGDAREKVEVYDNYIYVNIIEKEYEPGSNYLTSLPINVLLSDHVTFSLHDGLFYLLPQVIFKIKHLNHHLATKRKIDPHPAWVLYVLLDVIVDNFFNHVQRIEHEIKALDSMVRMINLQSHPSYLERLGNARSFLVEIRSNMFQKKDILQRLTSKTSIKLIADAKQEKILQVYLRDVADHINVMIQRLSTSSELLEGVITNYHGHLSYQAAEKERRMNLLMKRFGAVGTLVLPATFVTSLFGMNVSIPGEGWPGGEVWFYMVLTCLIIFVLWGGLYFKYKKFL